MTNKTMIAKAVKTALFGGLAATIAIASPVTFAAEDEGEDNVVVTTGTRLKRTDVEGSLPVTVIDREEIELSGAISAAELLRNTTFNSTGSFRPQSGSSAQGVSLINLRGIGSQRSLVLIDGRRMTVSPSLGQGQDLNSIPLAAIERIEILTDGASAIYGSDAIGGVVNVITRSDYSGAEIMLSEGSVSVPREGGDREAGQVLFGASNDTTSLLGGVSWNKRDIIFMNAFPWVGVGASIYGSNFTTAGGFDFQGIPSACGEDNFYIAGPLCRFNFNSTNANEASNANESIFLKGTHQINDDWELYAKASVAKVKSFGRYAPTPDSSYWYGSNIVIEADSYNNPTNPNAWYYDANNPNSIAYDAGLVGPQRDVDIWHRFAAVGNRDNTVNNTNTDVLVGATGQVGDFEVDFGVRRGRSSTKEIGNGYLAAATAWGFVNEFNPGYAVHGDPTSTFDPSTYYYGYNIQQPSSNPNNVLRGSAVTTSRESDFNIDEIYASIAFDVMELDGGTMQAFIGADRREEFYQDLYDAQSEAGLVGGSAGNSAGGGRSANAVYFETVMPFTKDFEVAMAGRYDTYSDYGSDFSPKIGMRYNVSDELLVRASYGEGFRAPTLDILTQQPAFSADTVADDASCDVFANDPTTTCQVSATVIANPALSSEQSKQWAVGFVWNPTDWLDLTLDYSNIEMDERIVSFGSQTIINRVGTAEGRFGPGHANYDPRPVPAGLSVTRTTVPCATDPSQNCDVITNVTRGSANEGQLENRNIDLNVHTNFDLWGGNLDSNLQVSYLQHSSINGGSSYVGVSGVPEWRAVLSNTFNVGDFQFGVNTSTIADNGNYGSWTTHDVQVNYFTSWDGTLTVGALNVGEKLPTIIPFGGRDYNYNLYNGYGRYTYVRYTQRF